MTQATQPYKYGNFVLSPRADGSQDLIDPATGRWVNLPTQRYARWTSTVISGFARRMAEHPPLPRSAIPDAKELP